MAGIGTFVIMFLFLIFTIIMLIAGIILLIVGLTGKGKRTECTIAGGILLGIFFLFSIIVLFICILGSTATLFSVLLPNQL